MTTGTVSTKGTSAASGRGERQARSPRAAKRRRATIIALGFLAPALVLLGFLVAYPVIYTAWRSLYDSNGDSFVGGENYVTMFTDPATFQAIKNNVIWVVVAPITCTILGLIFAVLLDKVKWSTAFKLIIFMPMAISMVAAGVIFRTMFQEDPSVGAANAALVSVHDIFGSESQLPGARPRPDLGVEKTDDGAIVSSDTVVAGDSQNFPLVGVRPSDVPGSAKVGAEAPSASSTQVTGTVWLDFVKGGGGTNGSLGDDKSGLPGVEVDAVDPSGAVVAKTKTAENGTYTLDGLSAGSNYTIGLPQSNFAAPYKGISWLGPSLVTAVIILAYVWIWAGFAMVMIASGLSAMDRSLQDAARIDGASEWKVFTRITAPLLSPVLVVVLVTLIINVLKIFDLVYVIPPGSSLPAANVIAVQMWQVSFGGGSDQGLGSALAVLLLVLVLPSMIMNVRRFRLDK